MKENQNLNKWYWKYYHKFEIVHISLDIDSTKWEQTRKNYKYHWYSKCDFQEWNSKPVIDYKITTLPASFILDPSGKIIAVDVFEENLHEKLIEIFGV